MARRFSRAHFVRPPKKTKIWIRAAFTATDIPSSTPVLISGLNPSGLALRPFTLLRTRMLLSVISNQIIATESAAGVFSDQVVTETASAAGIGSLPTPLSEANADFHVYQPYVTEFTFFDATGVDRFTQQYVIDSKAMRKVGVDDDMVFVAENQGSDGVILAAQGRQLIQLH